MIPLLCWLPFGVLRNIGEPSLGIGLAKPAWAAWDIWPVAGSFYVFFALVGRSVVRLALALPIVRELTRDPFGCAACGYPLAGIPNGVCPECGRASGMDDEPAVVRGGSGVPHSGRLGCSLRERSQPQSGQQERFDGMTRLTIQAPRKKR